jgi:hypothetical protein
MKISSAGTGWGSGVESGGGWLTAAVALPAKAIEVAMQPPTLNHPCRIGRQS